MPSLLSTLKRALPTTLRERGWAVKERRALARLTAACISRRQFLDDVGAAVTTGRGYAAAKIGMSQKCWMYYEIFLAKQYPPDVVRAYEEQLRFHGLKQEGLFPASLDFYLNFNRFYVEHVKKLDCLGVVLREDPVQELEIVKHYGLTSKLIHYPLQEPDRSSSHETNCYLPTFKNKRVLLLCPYGDYLRERATKDTFENVWSKVGKRWFYPSSVESIEFPYGFARETHQRYLTVLDLFEEIAAEISKRQFDVALVGAGALSIPIVSHVKSLGKVGIDLGGALQFTFGVSGKRWENLADYKKSFFNEHWTRLPARYRPKESDVCDNGAYW